MFYSRLILIAEKDTVYDKFPTPLINRMEKHFVLTSSILKEWQEDVLGEFENWISKFSDAGYKYFSVELVRSALRLGEGGNMSQI